MYFLFETLTLVIDHPLNADRPEILDVIPGGGADYNGTMLLGDLRGKGTNPACGAMD